ncbi:MAG: cytidylate kinase-like family protein [Actinobacteria bacterium]|nr:MAG: cytidylate kinase-like family protein [Actinomycetota bacterium]
MTIWTISAQEGTGGDWVAAELTAAADVPRLDREMLARSAHELNPDELKVEDIEEVEERFGGRLSALSLSMAMMTASTAAAVLLEIELRHRLPDLGRAVFNEVARRPCVILSPGRLRRATGASGPDSRAALRSDRGADRHLPRDHLVDRGHAKRAITHGDHTKSALVRSVYHVEIDD